MNRPSARKPRPVWGITEIETFLGGIEHKASGFFEQTTKCGMLWRSG